MSFRWDMSFHDIIILFISWSPPFWNEVKPTCREWKPHSFDVELYYKTTKIIVFLHDEHHGVVTQLIKSRDMCHRFVTCMLIVIRTRVTYPCQCLTRFKTGDCRSTALTYDGRIKMKTNWTKKRFVNVGLFVCGSQTRLKEKDSKR